MVLGALNKDQPSVLRGRVITAESSVPLLLLLFGTHPTQKCKRMEKSFKAERPKALPGVHVQGCGDMGRKWADTQCPVTSANKS